MSGFKIVHIPSLAPEHLEMILALFFFFFSELSLPRVEGLGILKLPVPEATAASPECSVLEMTAPFLQEPLGLLFEFLGLS